MTNENEGSDELFNGLKCASCVRVGDGPGRFEFVKVHGADSSPAEPSEYKVVCAACAMAGPLRGNRGAAVDPYRAYIDSPSRRVTQLEKDVESLKEELRCARFAGNESRESAETYKQERDSLRIVIEYLKSGVGAACLGGRVARESAETFKQERDTLLAERDSLRIEWDALMAQDEVNFSLWKKALCVVRESIEAIVSNKGVAAEDEAAEDEPKETTEGTENTEGWGKVRLDKAIKAVVEGDEPKKTTEGTEGTEGT